MKASDTITLNWCDKHRNWWVTNCPDCMVDANEEYIKKAGIKEVVEWVESVKPRLNNEAGGGYHYLISIEQWQSKLKDWGLALEP